jgi:hypothetical protein
MITSSAEPAVFDTPGAAVGGAVPVDFFAAGAGAAGGDTAFFGAVMPGLLLPVEIDFTGTPRGFVISGGEAGFVALFAAPAAGDDRPGVADWER